MKKMKRWFAAGLAVVMCLGLSACGKDFDAAGYTKSVLDANYHAEYAEYAEFRDISEEDAEAEVVNAMDEQITSAFVGMNVTDEDKAKYIEAADKVYALAKYEVGEAEKQDDGSFVVKVTVEAADAFQLSSGYIEEIAVEYANEGQDPSDTSVLVAILVESLERGIENNSYSEPTTVEVKVTQSGDNAYGIDQSEMDALEAALFLQ